MRNLIHKTSGKIFLSLVTVFFLFCLVEGIQPNPADRDASQEQEVKKARLYKDVFPLVAENDLYCSFFILKKRGDINIKIISAERTEERRFLREGDTCFINRGLKDGVENGQIYLILELRQRIIGYGSLAFMKGRAKIVDAREKRSTAKIEKACGLVMVGYYLVPFEEKGGLLGKDLGYDVLPRVAEGTRGKIIYSQDEHNLVGSGDWAIINLGEEDGIQFGQQLVVYRKVRKRGASIKMIGNLVVINVQEETSTVRVLSCQGALEVGDKVQPHFK
jgi:hypothetical protein